MLVNSLKRHVRTEAWPIVWNLRELSGSISNPVFKSQCEEGTTKPIPPQETEKIWHGSSDPQKVLQLVASLPGMATARSPTARHYRW